MPELCGAIERLLLGGGDSGVEQCGGAFTARQVRILDALEEQIAANVGGLALLDLLRRWIGSRPDERELSCVMESAACV
jgi:hypothetical protein